ncbi:hypothetical protein H1R20_g10233, partial [Candolleomyces eurysporus]
MKAGPLDMRRSFSAISGGADLATARIDLITKLKAGTFGLVVVDGELMLGEVLTVYERGGGKAAKHSWVSETTSIGSVSYMPVKLWQQIPGGPDQCVFRSIWHPSIINLPRFNHLKLSQFLLLLPAHVLRNLPNAMIELDRQFFEAVLLKYFTQKPAITKAVKDLVARRRSKKGKGSQVARKA